MSNYTIGYRDEDGAHYEVTGTLPELAEQLLNADYRGGKIRVLNDAGWTVGWVDAGHWSAT